MVVRKRRTRTLGTAAARLGMAAILVAVPTAGCTSSDSKVSCGIDQCTVTLDRNADASVSVLGAKVKLVSVNGDQVTVDVAGQQVTLTAGQAAVSAGPLDVTLDKVTEQNVTIKVSAGSGS